MTGLPMKMLWVVWFCSLSNCVMGQSVFKATVLDSLTKPIPECLVALKRGNQPAVLRFAQTDLDGVFELTIPQVLDSTLILYISALGYETQRIALYELISATPCRIILSEMVMAPVFVVAERAAIVENGDTSTFSITSFSDSTERSIAMVLKKMPGFEVSSNGTVKYNGQQIETLKIDGDEMFGSGYGSALNNIRPEMFNTVQVLENEPDNAVLGKAAGGDGLALNLTLRSEKFKLSGSYTLGAGYGQGARGFLNTSLYGFGKKRKVFLLADANNTGENPIDNTMFLANGGSEAFFNKQDIKINPVKSNTILNTAQWNDFGLEPHFTRKNGVGLLMGSSVLKWRNTAKTDLTFVVGQNRQEQSIFDQQRFTDFEVPLEINTTRKVNNVMLPLHIQLNSDIPLAKSGLRIRHYLNGNWQNSKTGVALNRRVVNSSQEQVATNLNNNTSDFFSSTEVYLPNGAKNTFVLTHKYALAQNYSLFDMHFAPLQELIGSAHGQQQMSSSNQIQQVVMRSHRFFKTQSLNYEVGYEARADRLRNNLFLSNEFGALLNEVDAFRISEYLKQNTVFGGVDYVIEKENNSFRAKMKLLYADINTSLNATASNGRYFLPEPRISYKYNGWQRMVLRLGYTYSFKLPPLEAFNNGSYFEDYGIINDGATEFSFRPTHFVTARLNYKSPKQGKEASVVLQYNNSGQLYGRRIVVDEDFRRQQYFPFIANEMWKAILRGSMFFLDNRLFLNTSLSSSRFVTENFFNDNTNGNWVSYTHANETEMTTFFNQWVNFSVNNHFSYALNRNVGSNTGYNNFQKLNILVKHPSKLNLRVSIYRMDSRANNRVLPSRYNSELQLNYPIKGQELSLLVLNFWPNMSFSDVFTDPISIQKQTLLIPNRFFVLKYTSTF